MWQRALFLFLALAPFTAGCGSSGQKADAALDDAADSVSDAQTDQRHPADASLDADVRSPADLANADQAPADLCGDADGLDTADASLPPYPALPLQTQGRFIVDQVGRRVRLTGVNWNGGHQEFFVPTGLDYHTPDEIAQALVQLGINSVRLTWSNQMVETRPMPDPAYVAGYPAGAQMNSLEVFDAVLKALTDAGILVILNNHTSDSVWCCSDDDGNGLWYTQTYPEEAWIADWVALAQRYADNPLVVGADLRNELRQGAQWSADAAPTYDWPSAAERAAEAVLAVRPDWLIFVEGIKYAASLEGVKQRPIELSVPNKLVYSVHEYSWFTANLMPDSSSYAMVLDGLWGYLLDAPYEVPVWVGEFGTCNTCWRDAWVQKFADYMANRQLDWCLWPIFGDADGWGLLSAETLEVHSPELLQLLQQWGLPQ